MKYPVIVIGGPTASGKSGLALALARELGGIVINADSMQLYQGLPILTAVPSSSDMVQAPHALYEILKPQGSASAASWRTWALEEIEQARQKKLLPIIVGGTGFYIKTLLQGLSPIPEVPHSLREEISALQKKTGNPAFHALLEKRDPQMAGKLHPFNTQRLIRAYEVIEATGKSLAHWQSLPPEPPPEYLSFKTIALLPPREKLYAACDGRFLQMLDMGAAAEAASFRASLESATESTVPLAHALGYQELCALQDGKLTSTEATTKAQQSTRNYAKRQMTWFRNQLEADLVLETPDLGKARALLEV